MAKNVTFSNENICLTFLELELQQKKTDWITKFLNNQELPELNNNIDWPKVNCKIKKETQSIQSILKKNQNIKLATKEEEEEIDPDIMIAKPNGGWGI